MPIKDQRGFFCRFFCAEESKEVGFNKCVAQINHSHTLRKGAVRGLHFQYPPHVEAKIVSCLRGEVFDVAVDIRKGSPTFLRWHGEILSLDNRKNLLIPEGFAHGFQALTENCEMIYLHSEPFHAQAEGGLHVNDPSLGIVWPVELTEISERDCTHPFISQNFEGITL
ncbi:dTDP-4-dehydrorhamnose 3,5-epimerase [Desulfovulcanus ferrireducens]|uniref:dTDP-4-dehydrorhamnose 3,5-epimerase n=1 Tax=Desulfovulcanus ferrireducens TaxID=2831190 RepID=UPI003369D0CB